MMLSQRVRGGVIRAKNKSSNGPLRAQSKGADRGISHHAYRVFCDVKAYVSSREHDSALLRVRSFSANQGGTANRSIFVPDRTISSVRDFF